MARNVESKASIAASREQFRKEAYVAEDALRFVVEAIRHVEAITGKGLNWETSPECQNVSVALVGEDRAHGGILIERHQNGSSNPITYARYLDDAYGVTRMHHELRMSDDSLAYFQLVERVFAARNRRASLAASDRKAA